MLKRFTIAAVLLLAAASAQAADKLGVILMHGKQGSPDKQIVSLASDLASEGYLVATPEMCWSKRRIYDRIYPDCIAELDKAADKLKADGATAIVVAGHSLGGNGALYYAATRPVKAVVLLAAAHNPERFINRTEIVESLAKAKAMIAEGRGKETANFNEVNAGWTFTVSCSADIYASFFDPEGPAVMPLTIAGIQAPILWVSGDRDKGQKGAADVLAKAPANPLNKHVVVSADHMDTPDTAIPTVREWLRAVAAQ